MPDSTPDPSLPADQGKFRPSLPAPKKASAGSLTELFTNPQAVESSDNTPTVISRKPPNGGSSPSAAEAYFTGSLRGRKLAHFELLEPIGVGGMAAVLKAHDTQLDRIVALKILPPDMACDPENIRRFHQEARAAARLDHENIARVFFCGEDQSLHFIAFEFVAGDNLRTILERRGRLPVPEALHYMLQVATGLDHAASRGVVHRDIKPSNIIITPTGRAKLVDMGLARSQSPHGDQGLTQSGVTLGTFDYISPEQALEPRDADVRSDIYSLGCTFYHVLTGQPPVPEGTAAKKLNHHQHVAPLDPRELNPAIPDEVTAILGRMMAKDPKDRYQRAEHLVQHLLQVTQRIGATPEMPDGVLFVDAALPNPPRPRPVLLAVAAGGALLVLLVLISLFSTPSPPPLDLLPPGKSSAARDPADNGGNKTEQSRSAPTEAGKNAAEVPPTPKAVEFRDDATAKSVADYLWEHSDKKGTRRAELEVVLNGDLDLHGDVAADEERSASTLRFRGHKLVLKAKYATRPVTIRLTDDARLRLPQSIGAALALDCDEVELHDLRFVIDAREPETTLACVHFSGPGREYQVERCAFIQTRPPEPGRNGRVMSILVDPRKDAARVPVLSLKHCYFAGADRTLFASTSDPQRREELLTLSGVERGGQEAVALVGSVKTNALDCAFGPHGALFRLQGTARDRADVLLRSCSAMLSGESTVFLTRSEIASDLTVEHCLFSRPGPGLVEAGMEASEDQGAVLIRQVRQTEGSGGALKFQGRDNRYHNLDGFWLKPDDRYLTWGDFVKAAGEQEDSIVLADSPWESSEPLKLLDRFDPRRLREAFQLKVRQPNLRQRTANHQPGDYLVGLTQPPGGGKPYNEGLPALPAERRPGTAITQRVVDPEVSESGNGRYRTLSEALLAAKPGDVILLHANRLVEGPIRLEKADLDVTLRPDKDFHPVLTLDEENTTEKDAVLFRVHSGKVKLEQLEFLLQPRQNEFNAQTVAAVFGDGQVTFKDCVITLDRGDKTVPLAVARVDDAAGVMKPARPDHRPGVHFDTCLVRGEGDLVVLRGNRPFDLTASNCLVVLSGSFVNAENTRENPTPSPSGQAVRMELSKVTASLGGSFIRLQAGKDLKGQVPIQGETIAYCLFASTTGAAFIHLDGPETSQEALKSLFPWKGQHNVYSNFGQMLDQQRSDPGAMAMSSFGRADWKNQFEGDAQFNPLKFADVPAAESLPRALPAQFRVKSDGEPLGCGAEIEALPKPASEAHGERGA